MPVTFNSVPTTAAASKVYVEIEAVNRGGGTPLLQHRVLVIGQYNSGKSPTDGVPQLILNRADAWNRYGRGSMLAAMIERVQDSKGGVEVYALPLADDGDSGVAATGEFEVSGTASATGVLALYVAGRRVEVAVASGDSASDVGDAIESAINADLDLPVTASNSSGTVTLTARWAGEAGNQIDLDSNRLDSDEVPAGITLTVTAMSSGASNPAIDTALGNIGDTWFTEIACPYLDTTSIGALESWGDDRDDPSINRMISGFLGYTDTSSNFITALGSRNSKWSTYVPVHGSPTPAYEIAASAAGVFAAKQLANPGRPCKGEILPGVVADSGNDLLHSTRDTIVRTGGSWTRNLADGRVSVGDLVTTRTETDQGAATDDYRWTVTIGALQFMRNATEVTFEGSPFDQAVVIGNDNPPGPTYAVRPNTVKQVAVGLVDAWTALGLIADRDATVAGITAEINSNNAGRIDLLLPVVISDGLRIVAVKLEFAPITG